jgi:hypothetical protein
MKGCVSIRTSYNGSSPRTYRGDILEKKEMRDGSNEKNNDKDYYIVRLRGATGEGSVVTASASCMEELPAIPGYNPVQENLREALYSEMNKESPSQAIRRKVMAMELADDIEFWLFAGTDPTSLDPLPDRIQKLVLLREIETFYAGEGRLWPTEGRSCTSCWMTRFLRRRQFPRSGNTLVSLRRRR